MSDERARLSERQAAIVRALLEGTPIPDGFDVGVIERARALLAQKREWVERRRSARVPRAFRSKLAAWLARRG